VGASQFASCWTALTSDGERPDDLASSMTMDRSPPHMARTVGMVKGCSHAMAQRSQGVLNCAGADFRVNDGD
jgi:hypothetical protein